MEAVPSSGRMMLRKAAPVMLALLIQSVYNIVDSLFVARFSPAVQEAGIQYAYTVMLGSFGLFTEGICTKILQAKGRMTLPMAAQVTGALINWIRS